MGAMKGVALKVLTTKSTKVTKSNNYENKTGAPPKSPVGGLWEESSNLRAKYRSYGILEACLPVSLLPPEWLPNIIT